MENKTFKLGLHWMRHDLRIDDNDALISLLEQCQQVKVVYVFDPRWLLSNEFGHCHLGSHRHAFLNKSLADIKDQLALHNIPLIMLKGDPVATISNLINTNPIDCMSFEEHYGFNERKQVSLLKAQLSSLPFIEGNGNYLLDHKCLAFEIHAMPDVFSPFRRKVEKDLKLRKPVAMPNKFEANNLKPLSNLKLSTYDIALSTHASEYGGGQSGAKHRIDEYFYKTDGISRYKETRNGLDGWEFSSRFSAYLAMGCVSPAYIFKELQLYENTRIQNDSTYWLFFELLWREFFHLQAKKQNTKYFEYGGIQQQAPLNSINASVVELWKNGQTNYPIVNACMNQLAATGFMSNRGRQLVASCFVHELRQDWRYGAAYFEEMLIDFDVASNYGNWQYLAGVGSDPRGHRQFDLEKQTNTYDPNRTFIKTWT